mmetsp:Transcript_16237/g.29263  ORF Transcript_16237/g.29263 Transcript_16237/m.29263 type:complete len:225 (-) Transcript_16237:455-1129(-)
MKALFNNSSGKAEKSPCISLFTCSQTDPCQRLACLKGCQLMSRRAFHSAAGRGPSHFGRLGCSGVAALTTAFGDTSAPPWSPPTELLDGECSIMGWALPAGAHPGAFPRGGGAFPGGGAFLGGGAFPGGRALPVTKLFGLAIVSDAEATRGTSLGVAIGSEAELIDRTTSRLQGGAAGTPRSTNSSSTDGARARGTGNRGRAGFISSCMHWLDSVARLVRWLNM